MARKFWTRIPAAYIDKKQYGRVVDAYAHRSDFLLLHIKSLRPCDPGYRKIGQWYLVKGLDVIDVKSYVGWQIVNPPIAWANSQIWKRYNHAKPPRKRHPNLISAASQRKSSVQKTVVEVKNENHQ